MRPVESIRRQWPQQIYKSVTRLSSAIPRNRLPTPVGTLTPSTSAWSMKDANPSVSGFALPDGVTADIETNTSTVLGTSTYSFRIPPRFTLQDGVQVSVDPNANNNVKDAYTFHMPPATLHTADDLTAGPDLDWLSDKGAG